MRSYLSSRTQQEDQELWNLDSDEQSVLLALHGFIGRIEFCWRKSDITHATRYLQNIIRVLQPFLDSCEAKMQAGERIGGTSWMALVAARKVIQDLSFILGLDR